MIIAAEHANSSNKLQWYNKTCSDIAAYQHSLDTELCNIEVSDVMHCKSMHCKNNIHINHIEEICKVLVDVCISSGNSCVPSATAKYRSHRQCLPGWNEHVRPAN